MDLMHRDQHYARTSIVTGIIQAYGKDEDHMTCQVRLPQYEQDKDVIANVCLLFPYVGKDHGICWRPEIGDEVVLAFFGQHEPYAVILGSLANASSWYWNQVTDKNEEKSMKLRNGWKMTFLDEKEKQSFRMDVEPYEILISQEDQTLTMQDKKKETMMSMNVNEGVIALKAKKGIHLTCGNTIIDISEQGIKIQSDTIEIASKKTMVKAEMEFAVEAQKVGLSANAMASIQSKGQLKLHANGITEVEGGIVKLG